ncbi:MAG: virginiamycin B lyase family protein [Caulobacteraceae bacterium]
MKAVLSALGLTAGLVLVSSSAHGQGGRQAAADALPSGPGHDTVATLCVACHEINRVTRSGGYDREGWSQAVDRMAAVGAPMTPAQKTEVVAYLAQHFPEQPKPAGVDIAGPVKVTFREWTVPTPGSRPHDPLGAPDGSLWWTGHMGNKLGRLDPKTGQMKEWTPTVAGSGPHGLVNDSQGHIWFTANFQGYIGELDPRTGKFKEYKIPDETVKDPHTPKFDQSGILWFTAQSANVIGRLDPKTGQMKLARSPTPRSNPYGMVITSKGVPVFDEFGANKIGEIDPRTMAIKEHVLPDPGTRPRRIAITSDDAIWYTDYSLGYLGRLDLQTGQVKQWPSPSGGKSQPYAITALKDVIWYVESNTKPNMLVRFDPKTEKFQTWRIPSGGGVVRNMTPTSDGGLALAESGVNKVALAELR